MTTLKKFHTQYIKDTRPKALITLVEMHLCNLTTAVTGVLSSSKTPTPKYKVLVSSKALKHLYDKKPAEEYDYMLTHAHTFVKYPDKIYINRDGKRGDYIFIKDISGEIWLCSIEKEKEHCYLVTCFRLHKESYLKNYKLIWSWKIGDSSS
jgi:hypothetical protein